MTAPRKKLQRSFDISSVPEGPGKNFKHKLTETIDGMLKSVGELEDGLAEVLEGLEEADDPAPNPRVVVKDDPYPFGTPLEIDPATHLTGTSFDNAGTAGDSEVLLPTVEQVDEAEIDRATQILHYRFVNTSGTDILRVRAGAGTTINVDQTDPSADGGTVDLIGENSAVDLALYDDQWRGAPLSGDWEIDAP